MQHQSYFCIDYQCINKKKSLFSVIDIKSSIIFTFCLYILKPAYANPVNFIGVIYEYFFKVIQSMVAWMLGNTNSGYITYMQHI